MILLDTHVLIWWITDGEKLSNRAKKLLTKARKEEGIYFSTISIWEIALLVQSGRLVLNMDVEAWVSDLEASGLVKIVPIDSNIAVKSVFLPDLKHKDPADRMIIATARELGVRLITKDEKILKYTHVQSVW